MGRRNLITGISASVGMLILVLDSRTALSGAQIGIELCIRTVIPALFPFFLLSVLLTGTLAGADMPVLKPLEKLTGIPSGAGVILLCGFLGGYPTGAKCTADVYRAGGLNRSEAERMLAFCSNAGPAFLFGMAGQAFSSPAAAAQLWAVHILSALLTALFIPPRSGKRPVSTEEKSISVSAGMRAALYAMAAVCGWVILFRVVLAFLDRWCLWMVPITARVLISGILELANGCCSLSAIADPDIRFIVCACMISFGGLCVTMQTASAAEGLSIKPYLSGKIIQTAFSFLLSSSIVLGIWIPVTVLLIFAGIIQKTQKRGRNPAAVGV